MLASPGPLGVLLVPFAPFVVTANGEPLVVGAGLDPDRTLRLSPASSGGVAHAAWWPRSWAGRAGRPSAAARLARPPVGGGVARLLPVAWLVVPLAATLAFSLVAEPIAVPGS